MRDVYDKELLRYAISDIIFHFMFSDLSTILVQQEKKARLNLKEHSLVKNKSKRYSEETYLKNTICTTLYLLHENITKKGFILRNKRDA